VLLDEPYPPELPVVAACEKCNSEFSLDEQYLSCFLECVICGTTDNSGLQRPKIKRILNENPKLRYRIEASKRKDEAGGLLWLPEIDRVRATVMKLARGHAAYELYPELGEPVDVGFAPLLSLSDEQRVAFENVSTEDLQPYPEIGTRAFLRVFVVGGKADPTQVSDWIVVQPGRYRYAVKDGLLVKFVLSEYLACMVSWE
jgi:hypothetical protein